MPNSYSQIYLHHVWSPKHRQALLVPEIETEVYKYITGIVKHLDQNLIRINGMPDHIHVLIRLRPSMTVSKLTQAMKQGSSTWINQQGFLEQQFKWQSGGAVFSVNPHQIDRVINYIDNQKEHHRKSSFKKEYINLLKKNHIEFKEEFLLDFFDDVY